MKPGVSTASGEDEIVQRDIRNSEQFDQDDPENGTLATTYGASIPFGFEASRPIPEYIAQYVTDVHWGTRDNYLVSLSGDKPFCGGGESIALSINLETFGGQDSTHLPDGVDVIGEGIRLHSSDIFVSEAAPYGSIPIAVDFTKKSIRKKVAGKVRRMCNEYAASSNEYGNADGSFISVNRIGFLFSGLTVEDQENIKEVTRDIYLSDDIVRLSDITGERTITAKIIAELCYRGEKKETCPGWLFSGMCVYSEERDEYEYQGY